MSFNTDYLHKKKDEFPQSQTGNLSRLLCLCSSYFQKHHLMVLLCNKDAGNLEKAWSLLIICSYFLGVIWTGC